MNQFGGKDSDSRAQYPIEQGGRAAADDMAENHMPRRKACPLLDLSGHCGANAHIAELMMAKCIQSRVVGLLCAG
jgi:hypothetical protein